MHSFVTSLICTLNILLCLQGTSNIVASETVTETRRLLKERRHEIFTRSLRDHFTKYGSELQHEVAHPRRITEQGAHLEYVTLDPLSEIRPSDNLVRKRRDLPSRDVSQHMNGTVMLSDGGNLVYYDVGAQKHDSGLSGALLKLRRNYQLVSKNYVVEERGRGGRVISRHNMIADCHYTGVIENHPGFSKVAMSLCNGLQGVIHKDNETFFIEPKWNHTSEGDDEDNTAHPHIITKRSIMEDNNIRVKDKEDIACGNEDQVDGKVPWKRASDEMSTGHHLRRSKRADADADEPKSNQHRPPSLELNVETLVVADHHMVASHGRDLHNYLLVIMNMVGSLYHDGTIGNAVNIIVTKIILLVDEQPDLTITHLASTTLNSFCSWQSRLEGDDTEVSDDVGGLHRHDNAVLVTGMDICVTANAPCGTVGLAPIGSMCNIATSCNINEDRGMTTAFTIAHEIGHNFGMQHDGESNECGGRGEPGMIMARSSANNAHPFHWSPCSRKYINEFLNDGHGACLLDSPPQRNFIFPEELAGQIYDADEQCRFKYGPLSRVCGGHNSCSPLWCSRSDRGIISGCTTDYLPVAEGTNCTSVEVEHGWCNRGKCVTFDSIPVVVHGGWGDWSPWGECSRSCGTGVSMSYRICNSPIPENGGRYCIGERERYMTCATQTCPDNAKDFRRMQCEQFNWVPYHGRYYNWLPRTFDRHISDPCALDCTPRGESFYYQQARAVTDGTRCYPDSLNICINGECHHVGCDNVLHSDTVEDKCRVCGGDGSSCITHSGIFAGGSIRQYNRVVTIPRGSVNIIVEEVVYARNNFIALQGTDEHMFLNNNWEIEGSRSLEIAGTMFVYQMPYNKPETLHARGPTNIDLEVTVLLQTANLGIKYEYNVPVENESRLAPKPVFIWEFSDWSPCSASCAGGIQRKSFVCKGLDDDNIVHDRFCDNRTMSTDDERTCNLEPCPATWFIGEWEECSSTCGGGVRHRQVICMRTFSPTEDEVTVPDNYCRDEKPTSEQKCNQAQCPPKWVVYKWRKCSVTCGPRRGRMTRRVVCRRGNRRVHPKLCPKPRPIVITFCRARHACISPTAKQCVDDPEAGCARINKVPNKTKFCTDFKDYWGKKCCATCKQTTQPKLPACNEEACPPKWTVSQWQKCPVACGRGKSRRNVICRQGNRRVHPKLCPKPRPIAITVCWARHPCIPPTAKQCVDDPEAGCARINKVPNKTKFCTDFKDYWGRKCCATCKEAAQPQP